MAKNIAAKHATNHNATTDTLHTWTVSIEGGSPVTVRAERLAWVDGAAHLYIGEDLVAVYTRAAGVCREHPAEPEASPDGE